MAAGPKSAVGSKASWPDERLIRECLKGDEEAWSALIDKYKNLIYSIPIKYEMSPEDAADIFQAVCLDVLRELPRLRKVKAFPKWVIQISVHKCLQWKTHQRNTLATDPNELEPLAGAVAPFDHRIVEAEEEQALRDAIASLSPRCRELVQMLFYETPAVSYDEIAGRLRLATGSIGFIRGRCLEKLRAALKRSGIR